MNTYAILELGTGKGVFAETQILEQLGLPVISVMIRHRGNNRVPAYKVDDISEALAISYEYDIYDMTIITDDTATTVDVVTRGILDKGTWLNVGHMEPESDDWTYDQESDSYYVIGE